MTRAIAALALTAAALACYLAIVFHARFAMDDFRAFYCAGRVALAHQDPYDAAPMEACESSAARAPLFVARRGFVLPAPVPGYAVAAFATIAWLPFEVAVVLWIALTVLATALAIALLARLGLGDVWSILVTLAIVLVAVSWPVGELPPLALLGIALAAWGVRTQRRIALASGIALTMLEPQVGIALAVAAVAISRRYAAVAVGVLVGLAALSLVVLGVHENVAYVRDVLPAHVRAELPAYFQYSLSWMLDRLGVAAGAALLAGRAWWIAMLGLTWLFARTPYAREHPEAAILAGPAFALVGGPFLHLDHVALAVPAALWVATRRASWAGVAALTGLALPLLQVFLATGTLALVPFVAFWIGAVYGHSLKAALVTVLCAIGAEVVAAEALLRTGFEFTRVSVSPHGTAISQAPWTQFVASHYVMSTWAIWLVKAPVWFGLVATAVGLLTLSGAKRRMTAS